MRDEDPIGEQIAEPRLRPSFDDELRDDVQVGGNPSAKSV